METLLDRGAEIGTVDASGNNALHYAASNGHEQVYLPCMIRAIFLTVILGCEALARTECRHRKSISVWLDATHAGSC